MSELDANKPLSDARAPVPPGASPTLPLPSAMIPLAAAVGSGGSDAGPSWRRSGKEHCPDKRTEEERKPIVINMARAEGLSHCRLLAVGVFLSLIAIPSKQLVNYMRNVWKIRGTIESSQLADKRFMLEFSEDGDFEHVTRGGPWRYQGDAVLVRVLKEGEDPEAVAFDSVPIWVQFAGLPHYLLSKELTRELGRKLGDLIAIDNNARGNLDDKIVRARVNLPVARALQRWITLGDEVSNKEVVVSVFYERLPTFCLCCGVIGHSEASCNLAPALRRRSYNPSIGVQPWHKEDVRCWYLAATTGQHRRALHMAPPWRATDTSQVRYAPPEVPQYVLVARVASLSVQEEKEDHDGAAAAMEAAPLASAISVATKPASPPGATALAGPVDTVNTVKIDSIGENGDAGGASAGSLVSLPSVVKPSAEPAKTPSDTTVLTMITIAPKNASDTSKPDVPASAPTKWKRRSREEEEGLYKNPSHDGDALQSTMLGAISKEQKVGEGLPTLIPVVESVLGKRLATTLHGQGTEDMDTLCMMNKKKRGEAQSDKEEMNHGTVEELEATSHGAAGQLAGAYAGACQEK